MRFRDEVEITVVAGDGGDGRVSFRREKYIPKGGPDGGQGGDGGNVVLLAVAKLMSLEDVATRRQWRAGSGQPGGANNCSGRNGDDLVIEVPIGTLVRDPERGHVLKDLDQEGSSVVIAKGGRGGRGNSRFATATDRVPTRAESGSEGERRDIKLELKIIADAGLVGFPNAGKSTLLGALTDARPKIGAYPFTTLSPNVGIVEIDFEPYVVADVPGLIEGASEGKGLGDRFLRHVERTRILLHLVDASDPETVVDAWRTVRHEVAAYSATLANKPELLLFTKVDLLDDEGRARLLEVVREAGLEPRLVSSLTREGIPELRAELAARVALARATG
jgi:GTP-binding protein